MTTPQVDIVIPTYNQASYLREALSSVVAQDLPNWRAIVVDNHSTDDTVKVIGEFREPRISVISFKNNGIIAASRNLAIRESSAPFVAFLDSDDWWHPSKLSRCITELEAGADLVCHAEEWRGSTSSRIVRYGPIERVSYRSLLLHGNCLSTSAIVARRSILQEQRGFSEEPRFVTAEDYELWLRLARHNYRFSIIPDVLGVFRIHEASASSSVERNSQAEMAVVDAHLIGSPIDSPRVRRRRRAVSHYATARAHHRAFDTRASLHHYLLALRAAPLFLRTYAGLMLLAFRALRGRR